MPETKTLTLLSVRIPREMLDHIDQIYRDKLLFGCQSLTNDDVYCGGRSTVVRLLLGLGLQTLQKRTRRSPRKNRPKPRPGLR